MPQTEALPGSLLDASRFQVPVRDPVWKHVWLTEGLRDVTQSTAFLRLYRIKQLGPTELVYPGATHSRASHSIGVYALALRILKVLVARGADSWVTSRGCDSFLAAALLHDLGHFPYTHSLKELPLEDHESLTARMILTEPLKSAVSRSGADPEMTAAIVNVDSPITDAETLFFRSILSGVLDPDKLDYLNRDAYYCGVPYGLQDVEFVLSRIRPDKVRGITLDEDSIMSIESVLFSKYLMYRSVYWHRQVRIATAMMKKALYSTLKDGLVSPETLYAQDDEGIYRLLGGINHPSARIATTIRERKFFTILGEYPFVPENAAMKQLEDLGFRSATEGSIAEKLSVVSGTNLGAENVLIDIPERISFESTLHISDLGLTFSDSSTVFNRNVVENFTASLRKVRIALSPDATAAATGISDLREKLAEWAFMR